MHISSTKLFFSDFLTGSSLHEGRSTQENGTFLLNHDDFVGHGGNVGSTSGTATHNDSDLRNTFSGHPCLVIEDSSEMITVREHIILLGKESTS